MKNRKIKLGFRVDVSNIVGTGHLMEVIVIIESLRKRVDLEPIVITNKDSFNLKKLKALGVNNIVYLTERISEKEEAEKVVYILKKAGCENLVIDLLGRSNEFYAYLKEHLESTFVILDNHEHKIISATVIVNFSLAQNKKFYENAQGKYFVGPNYALLNESINSRSPIIIKEEVARILISQGGVDPFELTAKIIKSLAEVELKQRVNIIVGGAMTPRRLKELDKMSTDLNGYYKIYSDITQEQIFSIMEKTDLAITAPGNTLYELAYFGIPCLVISHHERHEQVAEAFARQGAVINLGIGDKINEQYISAWTNKIIADKKKRLSLSENITKIVDGKGITRVVNILIDSLSRNKISLH